MPVAIITTDSLARIADSIAKTELPVYSDTVALSDSARNVELQKVYGAFAASANGANETVSLENDLVKIDFSTVGGFVEKATLKKYNLYGSSEPVVLNKSELSRFNVENTFVYFARAVYHTALLYEFFVLGSYMKAFRRFVFCP